MTRPIRDPATATEESSAAGGGKRAITRFGSFELDRANARVLRHGSPLALTPKAFGVLSYLIGRAGELVRKDQLFDAVWPNVIVTDAALTVCIREIRQALNDSTRSPKYIETVFKKGFRFIAGLDNATVESTPVQSDFVGRQGVSDKLGSALAEAVVGQCKLIFISGEAGIGKTRLLEEFARRVNRSGYWLGIGRCIEHHGAVEPYLPILDALGRLCRDDEQTIADVLIKYAPSWLRHLPAIKAMCVETVQGIQPNISSESMMREMAEALEALSRIKPLVLCLEDMHWSDRSTTEFLSFFACRKDVSRILMLVTIRPADTVVSNFPLREVKQNLLLRGLCTQIPLEFLTRADIAEYLETKYPLNQFADNFAEVLHQLSDGNPLFMVNILVALQEAQSLVETLDGWRLEVDLQELYKFVPNNLQEMIASQIEKLAPEHKFMLEAAGIAAEPGGLAVRFTLAEASAAADINPMELEEAMVQFARAGHFLRYLGDVELPVGSVSCQFEFTHALYQNVVYDHVRLSGKINGHFRIAEFLEQCYRGRTHEIAHKLAIHFELGRNFFKASEYLCQAARDASAFGGSSEALALLRKAEQLTKKAQASTQRDQLELTVLQLLAAAHIAAHGNADPEIEQVYLRMLELSQTANVQRERFSALFGLRSYYLIRGEFNKALDLALNLLSLSKAKNDDDILVEAHVGLASVYFYTGEIQLSYDHAIAGIEVYQPDAHADHAFTFGLDPAVFCYARAAQSAWILDRPDQALQLAAKGVALAKKLGHPYSHVFALLNQTQIYLHRQDKMEAKANAVLTGSLALQYGFRFLVAWSHCLSAWAYALTGEVKLARAQVQLAIDSPIPEAPTTMSFLNLFLAECYWHLGDWQQGLGRLQSPMLVRAFDAERARLLIEFQRIRAETLNGEVSRDSSHFRQVSALSGKHPASASWACGLQNAPLSPELINLRGSNSAVRPKNWRYR